MSIIVNLWNQSWEIRQAMKFATNGYTVSELAKLAIMIVYEIRYK